MSKILRGGLIRDDASCVGYKAAAEFPHPNDSPFYPLIFVNGSNDVVAAAGGAPPNTHTHAIIANFFRACVEEWGAGGRS